MADTARAVMRASAMAVRGGPHVIVYHQQQSNAARYKKTCCKKQYFQGFFAFSPQGIFFHVLPAFPMGLSVNLSLIKVYAARGVLRMGLGMWYNIID
ncbi:MAG: hypothetical protein IKK12_08740 [Clostridia bacterium]|nr:hypothetical protein [Clostridia bacterium]